MKYFIYKRDNASSTHCSHIVVMDDNKVHLLYVDNHCKGTGCGSCKSCTFTNRESGPWRMFKHNAIVGYLAHRLNPELKYEELTKEEFEQLIFVDSL